MNMPAAATAATAPDQRGVRRRDREITARADIDAILADTTVMHLALADGDCPFVVPVYFAYDGQALYFHSAGAGTKIDILRRNPRVCFEMSVEQGFIAADMACDFEARHRTAIGFGRAHFVEDEAAKVEALNRIVARFSSTPFAFPKNRVAHTTVVRIDIEALRGKQHGFARAAAAQAD
ncbi:MAG: pyridoxamine 5'-phosphate oxidase family protein [Rhodocyclaceae bacterium]